MIQFLRAFLQPSIVLPGALPEYATDAAIPQIFKGKVTNLEDKVVGRAQLQFDTTDALKYLSIEDDHIDGRLIAEEHFGILVRDRENNSCLKINLTLVINILNQ